MFAANHFRIGLLGKSCVTLLTTLLLCILELIRILINSCAVSLRCGRSNRIARASTDSMLSYKPGTDSRSGHGTMAQVVALDEGPKPLDRIQFRTVWWQGQQREILAATGRYPIHHKPTIGGAFEKVPQSLG